MVYKDQRVKMKKNEKGIAISVFKATCLEKLEEVRRTGVPLLVTRRGEAVALIMPPPRSEPWLGKFRGDARIVGDIMDPVVEENEYEVLES
jgi:hypothetical protein